MLTKSFYTIITGRVTTPAPSTTCIDRIPNCKDYTNSVCTGQYVSWAEYNCPKFCNLCGKYHFSNFCVFFQISWSVWEFLFSPLGYYNIPPLSTVKISLFKMLDKPHALNIKIKLVAKVESICNVAPHVSVKVSTY